MPNPRGTDLSISLLQTSNNLTGHNRPPERRTPCHIRLAKERAHVSRSYRKPYTAITGVSSAHHDKKTAVRGMRRRQNAWLRNLDDFDHALIPHRLECAHNDVWSWSHDGRQYLT